MKICKKCNIEQTGHFCSICGGKLALDEETNTTNGTLVTVSEVHKSFLVGKLPVYALRGVSLKITKGEFLAIMGPSGSGKSTLLHLIGALDTVTEGRIYFKDKDLATFNSNQLAEFRLHKVGFVFQTFHLIPSLTVLENVMLPLVYSGIPKNERKGRAEKLLVEIGLIGRNNHFPSELSGGEQQRVAVARAIVNSPPLILADEPTGDLDSKSGQKILDLLKSLNERGQTICMVTHDDHLAKSADRIVNLFDGKIVDRIEGII